ncbi:unnamed protein product [Urochloa humidicola]
MGNTGWRRSKNDDVATEASRRAVAKQRREDGVDEEEEHTKPRPRAARAAGCAATVPAGTVVTVRVVMRMKDAEALAARLHARARKARMAQLKGELRAGCGGGANNPAASCWSPQLAPIKEK